MLARYVIGKQSLTYMNIATNELNYFLDKYPSVSMMEVLMVDINGIIRCKRIPRSEFEELFTHGIKGPASQFSRM